MALQASYHSYLSCDLEASLFIPHVHLMMDQLNLYLKSNERLEMCLMV